MNTLLKATDSSGAEIHRWENASAVPQVNDLVTINFQDYIVFRRKWDTTDKSFGEMVTLTVGKMHDFATAKVNVGGTRA